MLSPCSVPQHLMANSGTGELLQKEGSTGMSNLLYCVQNIKSETLKDESETKVISIQHYRFIHIYTVGLVLFGLDRIRLGGQDSVRKSGYFSVVRNRLVQLVWSRIRLVWSGNNWIGRLLETVCRPQTCLTLQKFTRGTVGEFAFTVEINEQGNRQCFTKQTRFSCVLGVHWG